MLGDGCVMCLSEAGNMMRKLGLSLFVPFLLCIGVAVRRFGSSCLERRQFLPSKWIRLFYF